jgi:hypothetical protein
MVVQELPNLLARVRFLDGLPGRSSSVSECPALGREVGGSIPSYDPNLINVPRPKGC